MAKPKPKAVDLDPEGIRLSAVILPGALDWLRDVAAGEQRSVSFVVRALIDGAYRVREEREPPWLSTKEPKRG